MSPPKAIDAARVGGLALIVALGDFGHLHVRRTDEYILIEQPARQRTRKTAIPSYA